MKKIEKISLPKIKYVLRCTMPRGQDANRSSLPRAQEAGRDRSPPHSMTLCEKKPKGSSWCPCQWNQSRSWKTERVMVMSEWVMDGWWLTPSALHPLPPWGSGCAECYAQIQHREAVWAHGPPQPRHLRPGTWDKLRWEMDPDNNSGRKGKGLLTTNLLKFALNMRDVPLASTPNLPMQSSESYNKPLTRWNPMKVLRPCSFPGTGT